MTPPRAADPDLVYAYTKQAPALINRDGWGNVGGGTGAGTAHDTSGTAPNTATVTSWCGELFVQANITAGFAPYPYPECPASLNEVTAIMAVPFYNQTPRLLPANTVFAIKLPLQPVANLAGNIYTNIFTFSAPGMVGSPVTSNGSTTKVVAPDLTLAKTANPTQAKAGDAVAFTLVVKNISTDGPFASGAITVRNNAPAPSSTNVTVSGSACVTRRLLKAPKMAQPVGAVVHGFHRSDDGIAADFAALLVENARDGAPAGNAHLPFHRIACAEKG